MFRVLREVGVEGKASKYCTSTISWGGSSSLKHTSNTNTDLLWCSERCKHGHKAVMSKERTLARRNQKCSLVVFPYRSSSQQISTHVVPAHKVVNTETISMFISDWSEIFNCQYRRSRSGASKAQVDRRLVSCMWRWGQPEWTSEAHHVQRVYWDSLHWYVQLGRPTLIYRQCTLL